MTQRGNRLGPDVVAAGAGVGFRAAAGAGGIHGRRQLPSMDMRRGLGHILVIVGISIKIYGEVIDAEANRNRDFKLTVKNDKRITVVVKVEGPGIYRVRAAAREGERGIIVVDDRRVFVDVRDLIVLYSRQVEIRGINVVDSCIKIMNGRSRRTRRRNNTKIGKKNIKRS